MMFNADMNTKKFDNNLKVLDPAKAKSLNNYQSFCGQFDGDDDANLKVDADTKINY